MKKSYLLAVLVGVTALVALPSGTLAFHSPQLGRFLQRDPLMYVDGMSTYQYQQGRPNMNLDPMGDVVIYVSGYLQSDKTKLSQIAQKYGYQYVHIPFGGAMTNSDGNWKKVQNAIRNNPVGEPIILLGHSSGVRPIVIALEKFGKADGTVDCAVLLCGTLGRNREGLQDTLLSKVKDTYIFRGEKDDLANMGSINIPGQTIGQDPQGNGLTSERGDHQITEDVVPGGDHMWPFKPYDNLSDGNTPWIEHFAGEAMKHYKKCPK